VITAVEIHERDANDGPILRRLCNRLQEFHDEGSQRGQGYSGRETHDAIAAVGAEGKRVKICFKDCLLTLFNPDIIAKLVTSGIRK